MHDNTYWGNYMDNKYTTQKELITKSNTINGQVGNTISASKYMYPRPSLSYKEYMHENINILKNKLKLWYIEWFTRQKMYKVRFQDETWFDNSKVK